MSSQEHTLQKQFVELLHLNHILVISTDIMDGLKFCNSVNSRMSFIKHHQAMGYLKGQSDLVVIVKDAVIFVEMKTDTGHQSKEQKHFEKQVKELGHNYIVLHNWDDCVKFVDAITSQDNLQQIVNYTSINEGASRFFAPTTAGNSPRF